MNRRVIGCSTLAAAVVAVLCMIPAQAAPQGAGAAKGEGKKASSAATPHTADGHPDLSGVWTGGMGGGQDDEGSSDINVTFAARGGTLVNFERDNTLLRRMDPNRPQYKPEYWEKIQYNDQNEPSEDPSYGCMPAGVPRMGPPRKIIQTANEVVLFYQGPDTYRIIPTDGRPHTPDKDLEGTWMGESLGHWDGDTLVIDTIGFNDTSWLDIGGYFHSEDMKVIETLRRNGDTVVWQATVQDPEVLIKPWVMNPRTLKLNPDPKAILPEALPCSERDLSHLVTKEHH